MAIIQKQRSKIKDLQAANVITITTPPTGSLLFVSSHQTFQRSAAGTAIGSQILRIKYLGLLCSLTLSARSFASKRKMPPKKKVEEKKILLGRPGNSLKSGIVCMTTLTRLRQNSG